LFVKALSNNSFISDNPLKVPTSNSLILFVSNNSNVFNFVILSSSFDNLLIVIKN